jgi:signal transduction histidine kinase
VRQRVDNAEERLARLFDLQSLLAQVSRDIGPALELQPVLHTVLEAMRSLVDFRGGSICLVDEVGNVRMAAADPPAGPDVLAASVPAGTGLAGRVIASGLAVSSPDLDDDERVDPALRRLGTNGGVVSYLAVPLVTLGRVTGLVQIDSPERDAFDDADLQVLELLASQVAGAIESARRHEQVVELERLKSDFIARASHELRTPLTIVGGFTETLLALWPELDDDERTQILHRMQNATQRLQRLVDELLTVAGYEAGLISPHPVPVSLCDVLGQVQDDALHPDRVTVDCASSLAVVADPKLLTHALRLLVDNALKYAGDAQLVAVVEADTGDTIVEVVDHGPGIPPVLRDRVFERFIRGHDSNPGMGLGLPLVKMLAGACGAGVELHHPPDGGAVFRLRFPPEP